MNDHKKRKIIIMSLISLIFLFLIILFIIFIFNNNENKEEKSVLYCYSELSINNGIGTLFMSYEIIQGKNHRKINALNNLVLDQDLYNKLSQKNYSVEKILNSISENLVSDIKEINNELEEYISYKTNNHLNKVSVEIMYDVNAKSKDIMYEYFEFDFYEASISEIQSYYEAGDFICERK